MWIVSGGVRLRSPPVVHRDDIVAPSGSRGLLNRLQFCNSMLHIELHKHLTDTRKININPNLPQIIFIFIYDIIILTRVKHICKF